MEAYPVVISLHGDRTRGGWYDDGHGKQRWWDGLKWTEHFVDLTEHDVQLREADSAGTADSFGGIVVDVRTIRFGPLAEQIAGARAEVAGGADLLRSGRLGTASRARVLVGPGGVITPRLLPRAVDPAALYLVIDVQGKVWIVPVPPGHDVEAGRFATWVNASSEHYRYR